MPRLVATAETFLPREHRFPGGRLRLGDLTTFLNGTGCAGPAEPVRIPRFRPTPPASCGRRRRPEPNRSGDTDPSRSRGAQVRRSDSLARDQPWPEIVYASVILETYRVRNPDAADRARYAIGGETWSQPRPRLVNSVGRCTGPSRTELPDPGSADRKSGRHPDRMEWMDFAATNFGLAFADLEGELLNLEKDSDGLYCSTIYRTAPPRMSAWIRSAQIIDHR